jgi:DNA-binding CsgD family transcriptional regulator
VVNHWYVSQNRTLSPTERAILQCMTRGLSMPEIAVQLERNIKTIRAHKFNAMAKLGVNSDVGLLNAADILTWVPAAAALRGSIRSIVSVFSARLAPGTVPVTHKHQSILRPLIAPCVPGKYALRYGLHPLPGVLLRSVSMKHHNKQPTGFPARTGRHRQPDDR